MQINYLSIIRSVIMDRKTEINSLLDGYEEKLAIRREQDAGSHAIYLKSEENILRIEKKIIIPTIKKIGEIIKEHGHNYEIIENPSGISSTLRLTIYPKPHKKGQSGAMPDMNFIFETGEKTVRIFYNPQWIDNPSARTPNENQYNLTEITPELVEKEIVSFLHMIF